MKSKPLVSVIVIFLNEERFIREAIESVFAQTYDNWELLLVDDGSTDGSTQIALEYAKQYPATVRYLEHSGHQNRGMSASRNLGLSRASGDYIGFLDADDVWLPYKLRRQVALLNSHPKAGMVYGSTQHWYSWTGKSEDRQRDFVRQLGVQTSTLFKPPVLLSLLYPLGIATTPSSSNFLLRREVVERTGAFEEDFRGINEDQAFMAKLYLKEHIFVADECWDRYRQHPDSCFATIQRQRSGRRYSLQLVFLDWLAKYLFEQGLKDPKVWRLLQEERHYKRVRICLWEREWRQAVRAALVLLRHHPWRFALECQRLFTSMSRKLWVRFLH